MPDAHRWFLHSARLDQHPTSTCNFFFLALPLTSFLHAFNHLPMPCIPPTLHDRINILHVSRRVPFVSAFTLGTYS